MCVSPNSSRRSPNVSEECKKGDFVVAGGRGPGESFRSRSVFASPLDVRFFTSFREPCGVFSSSDSAALRAARIAFSHGDAKEFDLIPRTFTLPSRPFTRPPAACKLLIQLVADLGASILHQDELSAVPHPSVVLLIAMSRDSGSSSPPPRSVSQISAKPVYNFCSCLPQLGTSATATNASKRRLKDRKSVV